jgi:hypothetical protein
MIIYIRLCADGGFLFINCCAVKAEVMDGHQKVTVPPFLRTILPETW